MSSGHLVIRSSGHLVTCSSVHLIIGSFPILWKSVLFLWNTHSESCFGDLIEQSGYLVFSNGFIRSEASYVSTDIQATMDQASFKTRPAAGRRHDLMAQVHFWEKLCPQQKTCKKVVRYRELPWWSSADCGNDDLQKKLGLRVTNCVCGYEGGGPSKQVWCNTSLIVTMMLIMMMVVMMMSFSVREAVSKEVRNDIVEQCSANPYLIFIISTNSIVSVDCKKSSSKFK